MGRRQGPAGCPAYAGMDPHQIARHPVDGRLPRLRGDGPRDLPKQEQFTLAAPPTRGWTLKVQRDLFAIAGCPAYAGMDPLDRH